VPKKVNCNSLLAAPSMQLIFNQCKTLDMKISKSSSFALPEYGLGSGIFTPALERGE
jgi:hypothetical protein